MSNELELIERAVEVNFGDDDVLIVKSKGAFISQENAERLRFHFEQVLSRSGNHIVVLGNDLDVVVLHRELPAIKETKS